MEKYEALTIEIISFDGEDVITTSTGGKGINTPLQQRYYDESEEDE